MATQGFYGSGFLLVGASSGIGLATAKKLHSLGGDVVISGLSINDEIEKLLESSPRYRFIAGDLSEAKEPARIVAGALEHLPQLNGVLFAAGMKSHLSWEEISPAEWDQVFAVNTRALLLLAQSSIRYLRESHGSIVAISSTNGENVNKNNLVYDISKAALNHLIRALALELRDEKIRVNGIAPGGVDTPLLHQWLNDYAGDPESAAKVLAQSRASGLLANPDDIADIAAFLFSESSRWINGAIITADFGASLG
jgi:NAD(P)-dependent dehydrogenase (short-subunit alcohol dehydrogenase family)